MAEQIALNDALYHYTESVSLREPEPLRRLREETGRMERHFWQISALQGQFMQLLVKLTGAKRILEVGTFTGYSSAAMALALPADGHIVTCDVSDEYTAIAKRYWAEAGVEDKIELRMGPGVETLDAMIDDGMADRFDMAFVDANKNDYYAYFEQCLTLVRQGGLIIIDNTLFDGRVIGQNLEGLADWQLAWTEDIKAFNEKIHHDERIDLSMVPVGDGMSLCLKR